MGKSRSATIVVAYLMWKYRVSVLEALEQLREGRPVCGPNPGFMEQLEIYSNILNADNKEDGEGIYQKWSDTRFTGPSWEWAVRGKL
jgi:dual specificity phosphatase 12